MKHLIIYFLITYNIIGLIYCDESTVDEARDAKSLKSVGMTLSHPSQNGYQSVVLGTDKHKYGYEIKHQGKHFHHTSTEKDGVRLGCYGHELDGKQYLTQYVADAKGYRLVTTEDLIIVYPKSGRTGKAVFADDDANEETLRNAGVRYVFPKGCKGIDVQIDNSSRLRSLNGILRNFEISPRLPVNLPNRTDNGDKYTYYKPSNSYPGPSHIYADSNMLQNTYLPPQNSYLPPANIQKPLDDTKTTPSPNNPSIPPFTQPSSVYEPPKESETVCGLNCCEDSTKGKLVIPIPLKNRNSNDCCSKTAQLILPLKNIDITIVAQLRENLSHKEFDADQLIRSILENLL